MNALAKKEKYIKKRKYKKYAKKASSLYNWMGKPAEAKIHLDVLIYAVHSAGSQQLSFGFNNIATSKIDIGGYMCASHKWVEMIGAFGYFQLTGMKLQYQRMQVDSNFVIGGAYLATIPPFGFIPDGYGSTNTSRVYDYDNAYIVDAQSHDSNPKSKYYRFPLALGTGNVSDNHPLLHLGPIWQQAPGAGATYPFYLSMGYPQVGLLGAGASGNGAQLIGSLRVTCYTKWCMPVDI